MVDLYKQYRGKLPLSIINDIKEKTKGMGAAKVKKVLEKTYEEYLNAKVDAGESVGLVSAESIGEPGTQMCVDADERVVLKSEKGISILKIGDFADKILDSSHAKQKVDGYEFCNLNDEIFVLGLNSEEKVEWKRVSKVNRVKSPKRLIKIKTRSGRQITATDFHSFVTRKNNKVVSMAGKELRIGDRIPVVKYLPEHCTDVVNVKGFFPKNIAQSGLIYGQRPNAKPIPDKIKLDKLFGWFIGAYLAEGASTYGQVLISNSNDEYILNARKFIKSIGLDYKEEFNSRGFALGRDFKVSSTLLAGFIKGVCDTGSKNKIVPDFAYSAKEDFVSGLLRGYFDGDGNITVPRRMIRVSSYSKELIDGIALLLTRFSIFANKTKDKKGQYWLQIPYKYAPAFLEHISLDILKKRRRLEKLARLAKSRNIKSLDQTDMISGFDDVLYQIARKLGMRTRYINNFTKRQKIGRTTLYRYIKLFESLALKKKITIGKELKILRRMFKSDVVWDEIVKIDYVSPTNGYVYDLTVPGLETFTTFDGIVTHNTLNTFHFAGVAEMNVTVGLPRIIEILDGRKKIKTPMMEIYLKSPYSKGKDIRKLALSIKETTSKDIMREVLVNIAEGRIEIRFDGDRLKEIGVNVGHVIAAFGKQLKGVSIRKSEDGITVKIKGKEERIGEIYKIKEKIKDIYIRGIKGIKQVLPVKRGDEFIIITAGSNLSEVLGLKEVDETRTISNDIFEIADILGIEAARQTVINEVFKVIEAQGLNVDVRHIMLVADTMCISGDVRGITRYGVVSEKASVLARASFETPIKHIINAALIGEVDKLSSVVENVMLNQPVPVGTGLPGLVVKVKK